MKKILAAATIAVMLSAGLTIKTQAQSISANIEILSAENTVATTPHSFSETALYDKAGILFGTVKRYEGASLPKEINSMIRNQFTDFDIIGVEEVTIPAEKTRIYYVHIGNDKNLETIKVFNGESEVINKYKRG